MLSWIRKFFSRKSVSASQGSVAIGRDNYGPIYIGHPNIAPFAKGNAPALLTSDSIEAISPEHRTDRVVHLALSSFGVSPDTDVPVCTSVYLVTDAPDRLRQQLQKIPMLIQQDSLIDAAAKTRARGASLQQLVNDPGTKALVLRELAVMSFSAYLYYCPKEAFNRLPNKEREYKLFVVPLVHRLSKKGERFEQVHTRRADIPNCLTLAAEIVLSTYHRDVNVPQQGAVKYSELEELTALIAQACSQHLSEPENAEAASLFENLRTRIRYAENIVTGEKHTRDVHPLP